MMRRREHEADTGFGDAASHGLRRKIDVHTERGKDIGCAGPRRQRAVAMFGDRNARAGDNERRASGNVERTRRVAARADDVDRIGGRAHAQHFAAHRGNGPGYFIDGLAAHAKPHNQRAHLRGRRLARHHLLKGAGRFFARERRASRDFADKRPERVGPTFFIAG